MIVNRIRRRHARPIPQETRTRENLSGLFAVTLVLAACAFWSYWPTIAGLFKVWRRSDDYSAGQLVPLVALFLLWRERENLSKCLLKPHWVAGIALVAVAQAARMYGLVFMYDSGERYSIVVTIAGLVLMVGGWQVFRRVLWILLLLFLMVPLPGRVHNMISGPLQSVATAGAVFVLEAFIKVSQEGNIVMLNDEVPMAVVEACSGLRMLMAFIIVACFMAYMVKRSRLQKAVLLLSSVPVAVVCNILRLCVTAVLFLIASTEVAERFFHDFAGLVMMPAAVLLMFAELWLMEKLKEPAPGPVARRTKSRTEFASPPDQK